MSNSKLLGPSQTSLVVALLRLKYVTVRTFQPSILILLQVVISAGAVPIFVELLASPEPDVREQAVWALGNIAGDSPHCRDFVLGAGALRPLLNLINDGRKLSMLRNATWTLSNFCRGKTPQPDWNTV